MPEPGPFQEWYARVQAGDEDASAELVRRVEPMLRKVIRGRLARLRLGHLLEVPDLCQTVLVSFFTQVVTVRQPITSDAHLRALLVTIARNKIRDESRRYTADRRDYRRLLRTRSDEALSYVQSADPAPSRVAAGNDLYREVLRRLTADERRLFEERAEGRDWATIAAAHGVSANVVRKKLNRALQRVRCQLQARGSRPAPVAVQPQ